MFWGEQGENVAECGQLVNLAEEYRYLCTINFLVDWKIKPKSCGKTKS